MTRPLYILLLLTGPAALSGDVGAQLPDWTSRTSLSGALGSITVDRRQWQRVALRPALRLGHLEAAFDVEVFIDEQGRLRNRGWDFSTGRSAIESILRKVHHIQYGDPSDLGGPVYVRVGALEDVTLGHGAAMRRYRNTFGYPGIKRAGLDLQVRHLVWEGLTVRGMVSDLADLLDRGAPVAGGRVSARTWGPLEVGGSLAVDTDQLGALPDSVRAGRPRDPYGVCSVDAQFPLYQARGVYLSAYGGIARSVASARRGTGFFGPGLMLIAGRLAARAEGRLTRGAFEPDHFDALYDQSRALVDPATGRVIPSEASIPDGTLRGLFVDAELDGGRFLRAVLSYQHLIGEGLEDRALSAVLSLRPELPGALDRITLSEGFLQKRSAGRPGRFLTVDADTRFGYRVGLRPAESVAVIWELEYSFVPNVTGGFERRRTLNLQTEFGL
jgi:hypothetical protein